MSEISSFLWWKEVMSSSVSAFTTRKLPAKQTSLFQWDTRTHNAHTQTHRSFAPQHSCASSSSVHEKVTHGRLQH